MTHWERKQSPLFSEQKILPENVGVFPENGERLRGNNFWIGIEKKVLDPTHIAVGSNSLGSIAEGVRRSRFIFLRLRKFEELESLVFERGHEVQWDAMVDELEEAEFLGGLDYEGLGVRVREVDFWDFGREEGGGGGGLAGFDEEEGVERRRIRENHHG
ncbi:hypothetical protein G2W53_002770 [Senna tora]|uniref:Uncharacterized protein n=1 Tax=Senna tora TaxID=362788 RepID=A0A834X9Z9_9FABA|nr:hypothetical protein G2W53_002770 [Senna tora]